MFTNLKFLANNTICILFLSFCVGVTLIPSQASAFSVLPTCSEGVVAQHIKRDFNWAERNTWYDGFTLVHLERMHEHEGDDWPNSSLQRRYCMATASMSDGTRYPVYYLIEDKAGFVGQTWNVTFCVEGLDSWHNQGGRCRSVR